jgi:hypothetical protein
MKLLTGEWVAAEQENKALRDRLRKQFWSDVGIKPAKNTSEVDIAPAARLALLKSLVDITLGGKEGDKEMKAVTALAGAEAAKLAVGSFAHGGKSLAPDMNLMAPTKMRLFFLIPDVTSYERARNNSDGDNG